MSLILLCHLPLFTEGSTPVLSSPSRDFRLLGLIRDWGRGPAESEKWEPLDDLRHPEPEPSGRVTSLLEEQACVLEDTEVPLDKERDVLELELEKDGLEDDKCPGDVEYPVDPESTDTVLPHTV